MFWNQLRLKPSLVKMLTFLLIFQVLLYSVESVTIDCTCGIGSYAEIVKEPAYTCSVIDLKISLEEDIVDRVNRQHEVGNTSSEVKLLKIIDQCLPELPENLDSFFATIDGLEVLNSGLKTIQKEKFSDYKNLKYLNLMKNKIETLHDGVFSNSPTLQYILLNNNRLKVIGSAVFTPITNLKYVDVRRNTCLCRKAESEKDFPALKEEIKKKCPPKIEVYCTFAEQDFVVGCHYTCEVRFWIILIDYMAVSNFEGRHSSGRKNSNVRALRVSDMTTKYFPIHLCYHFPKLLAIEIVGAKMARLEKRDMKQFRHLRVLWLPRNNIERLANDVFEGNPKLEKISFWGNRLKFIESEILAPLPLLKFVSFQYNECINRQAWIKDSFECLEKDFVQNCSAAIINLLQP